MIWFTIGAVVSFPAGVYVGMRTYWTQVQLPGRHRQ